MADWFIGDERSGTLVCWVTIFNGYNEDHVRADLKPAIERFRQSRRIGHTRWTQGELAVKLATFNRGGTYSPESGSDG